MMTKLFICLFSIYSVIGCSDKSTSNGSKSNITCDTIIIHDTIYSDDITESENRVYPFAIEEMPKNDDLVRPVKVVDTCKYCSKDYILFPYGFIKVTDELPAYFFKQLTTPTRDSEADSINSLILMSIADISDSALSEKMLHVCYDDFYNKPNLILNIFKTDPKRSMSYLRFVYWREKDLLMMDEDKNMDVETLKKQVLSKVNEEIDEFQLIRMLKYTVDSLNVRY